MEKIQTPNRHDTLPLVVLSLLSLVVASYSIASDLVTSYDELEPSINIKSYDNRTVEEYSNNNNVYMMKITPKAGAPYYLVDPDGSGEMEWKRDTNMDINPPRWTLRQW